MTEIREIVFEDLSDKEAMQLVGAYDANLNALKSFLNIEMSFRNNSFFISNCDDKTFNNVKAILTKLRNQIDDNSSLSEQNVIYVARSILKGENMDTSKYAEKIVGRTLGGKPICPKTEGQYDLVDAMDKNTIVFSIGPAGTGKTYLSVIYAVNALKKGDVKRIVLTRPAVEAGENLGFLPGDLKEKVDPYLTPLYDALNDMLGSEQVERLIERGTIEVAPLAYMRGRTLDDSYVILDEAQNTTTAQMKMFLTRLGFNSHMVINGDITQIDLNSNTKSGLVEATSILRNMDDIAIIELSADDVVRHPLVQKIIERYEVK